MNIKWAYCLIAVIYVMLIILKGINYFNQKVYEKDNPHYDKVFFIKKDFFTTVAVICVIVTLAINLAALLSGKALNTSSIIITVLVLGFTILNSLGYLYYEPATQQIFLLGYIIKKGDIESVKCKSHKKKDSLDITFTREIESYNYMKLNVYGKARQKFITLLQTLKQQELSED